MARCTPRRGASWLAQHTPPASAEALRLAEAQPPNRERRLTALASHPDTLRATLPRLSSGALKDADKRR